MTKITKINIYTIKIKKIIKIQENNVNKKF